MMKTKLSYLMYLLLLSSFFVQKKGYAQDWGTLNSGITDNLNDVIFADENTGLAVGDAGRIIGTLDAGATWNLLSSGTVENILAVDAPTNGTLIACGSNGLILRSTNAGFTWSSVASGTTEDLLDVTFFDANIGVISGSLGTVLTTSDGGQSWNPQNSTSTSSLNGNCYTTSGNIYAVGDGLTNPTILVSYNSGVNWSNQTNTSLNQLNDVVFTDDNNGFAVGAIGSLLTTNNGGTNWAVTSISPSNLNGISFLNDSVGFTIGTNGAILKTVDYGVTWNALTSNTTESLNGISMLSELSGYSVGNNGEILRTCPTANFTSSLLDSICEGETVDFTNQSSAAESFLWLVDGDTIASTTDLSYTFTGTGAMDVVLVATNSACSSQQTESFIVSPVPAFDLGNDTTICSSCSDTLYGPTGAGLSYQWFYNGNFNGNISDVNIASSPGEYVLQVTNNEGCVGSDTVNVMMTNSLFEPQSAEFEMIIYPNPATNEINILMDEFQNNAEIKIFSVSGQLMHEQFMTETETSVDVTSYPGGVYYVTAITPNMVNTVILLKE